jgi:hypothetical protein
MKTKIISLFSFFALLVSSALINADDMKLAVAPVDQNHVIAGSQGNNKDNKDSSKSQMRNTWTPYFYCMSALQPKTQTFVQVNVGTGFLYFSGVRGNLQPQGVNYTTYTKTSTPLQRRFNYNRTPLYEAIFGYQFNNWFKAAVSFQAQSDVTVSSDWQLCQGTSADNFARRQLTSDVTLYGIAAKVYFNFPYALVWKMMSFDPFIGLAIGPSWQTWTRNQVVEQVGSNTITEQNIFNYSQKISANALFMTDIGINSTWVIKKTSFTLVKGMKFNIWGQARSIGKQREQQFIGSRESLSNPLRIKTVYQFAPYLGLQWNF